MSQPPIVPLDATSNIDVAAVGPKAASLIKLNRIGLAVPSGFCIVASVYREHLEANGLVSRIESVVGQLADLQTEGAIRVLSRLREAIIGAPMIDSVKEAIEKHYRMLGVDRVAVRSSATAEDLPDHSFAGQYDTYLGVSDFLGCIDAVKKCWASLWNQRAYDYRRKNGFDHLGANMAVIVQALVEADASGVIFTADPVNGYQSRVIIETVGGLGDSLVSGKATPLRIVIEKKTLRIISRTTSDEKINGELSKILRDETIIKKLAKMAKKAEIKLGSPQDIEWAISEKKIFFLQSRPITAIPPKKSWEDRQVWTNAAFRDVAPDVLTPSTWSLMEQFIKPLFGPLCKLFAVNIGNTPIAGLVAGRVYLNINTFMAVFQNLPDSFHTTITKSFGGQHQKQFDLGQIDIPPEDLPDIKLNFLKALLYLPRSIYILYKHRSSKAHALLKRLTEINKTNGMRNLSEMSQTQRIKLLFETTEHQFSILYFFTTLSYLPMVQWFCEKWLGDENGQLANSLLAGSGQMQDVQAGIALWELAQKAATDAVLKETVLVADNWSILHPLLQKTESGRDFLKSWDEFMAQHGHHCRGEILLFNPRWYETPDYILSIVKSYIEVSGIHNPAHDLKQKIIQRQHLLETTVKKFKNPIKKILLKHAVIKTRKGLMFRENVKSEIVRLISSCREVLMELGQRLAVDQTLEKRDDIFFLQFDEIAAVVEKKVDFDIPQTIKNRCLEYEKYKSISPPEIIIGRFVPDTYVPEEIDTQVTVFKGTSACPGIVQGPARVILRADENQHVQPGEILIAPFTDPGWTPYFVPAAAIVMDQGGLLSHGSIIAREYGIPAVVNVGPATRIIKTGQTIQVDANRGIVRILK